MTQQGAPKAEIGLGSADPSKPGSSGDSGERLLTVVRNNVRQYGMLVALVVIIAFFQFTTSGTMLRPQNVTNVFLQNGYIIAMALGMLLIIVSGHIDLSVGSVAAFTGAIAAVVMVDYKLDPILAVLAALLVGGLIGAWQGFWVAYMRIPSFIVTLSGMLLFRGLTLFMLNGQPVGPFPESFRAIASGFIPEPIGSIQDPFGPDQLKLTTLILAGILCAGLVFMDLQARREQLKYGFKVTPFGQFIARNVVLIVAIMYLAYRLSAFFGLPVVLALVLVLIAVYMFLTGRTVIGRRIYAVGGNAKAATLSGVKTKQMVFLTFINMGVLSAVGGLISTARFNSATPKAGDGFELDVIAATFVGGASAYGGIGTVAGAVIGALVLGVLNIGMGLMGIGIDYQFAIKALVLLGAVFVDVRGKNKDS
ncbi:MAG TPA: multiple monosaccharide ABC transporter permease [Candidatus Limnocylindrales bacterium]|jgi:putative multiple sugar transport system permease protein